MGINTELQVGDIVKLKVGDVKGKNSFISGRQDNKKQKVNISMLSNRIDKKIGYIIVSN